MGNQDISDLSMRKRFSIADGLGGRYRDAGPGALAG